MTGFSVADRRLHGSLNGNTVFDLIDDRLTNNEPVYHCGRVGLRVMDATAMRDLRIWNRSSCCSQA